MQRLRSARSLARLVLAMFALVLAASIASPIVQPDAMQVVCTDVGTVKLVVVDDDGSAKDAGRHGLDCPACLAVPLPPPDLPAPFAPPDPLAHAVAPITAARLAALVGAPLPPRGPPAGV